jgi:hypothetical protein
MASTREYSVTRWHSRAGFLATTLLALLAMGAPFMVTRGLIEHGALFLPAVLALMLAFGGPLVRIALSTGRLSHRLQGRESVHAVQLLVRVTLALVLLMIGGRAAGWIFAETLFEMPQRALDFRARELTTASTAWHTTLTPALWAGMFAVVFFAGLFTAMARRRGLAGISWIAGWVLAAVVVLLLLGLVVGYSLPGAGALAAIAAPLRWSALLELAFWGDAAAVTMLGLGAQAAVLKTAGRGLPKRASVSREARILVAGISFLTVIGGLVGLLLLCALCVRQGIVPDTHHAAPGVLLIELVPALGRQLFPSWPEAVQPTERQITLVWCFLLAVACSIGAAALAASRSLGPQPWKGRGAWFGFAAALVAACSVAAGYFTGTVDAWLPMITLMPALLAVMHLTLARRAGADLRVVASAFASSRAWLEYWNIAFTFRILRPVLLLVVLAVALSRREYGVVLGGFAVSFALMWIGSLRPRPRNRETGMLRGASAAALIVLAGGVALAQSPADRAFDEAANAREPGERAARVESFERHWQRGASVDISRMHALADALLQQSRDEQRPATERRLAVEQARAALACVLVADAASDESLRLERAMLADDELFPYAAIDEAISDHTFGQPQSLAELLTQINARLDGDRLGEALRAGADLPHLLVALVADMQRAYGAGGRESQRLRAHLLQRASTGRTLLKPQAAPGVAYIATVLAAACALAAALMLGVGRAR